MYLETVKSIGGVNINYTGKVIHLMKIYFQVLQKIVVK